MKSTIHFIVSAFLLMGFSENLISQIKLTGAVLDQGAEPAVNMVVEVTDQQDTSRKFSSITDARGQYLIHIFAAGVGDLYSQNPIGFNILQNFPNPFNPSTVIAYKLSHPSDLRIEIHNVLGQKLKTLFSGFESNTVGHIIWDATDDLGQSVAAGVYICSMTAEGNRVSRKMLLADGHTGYSNTAVTQTIPDGGSFLNKKMSEQYTFRITGDDIEPFEQKDVAIDSNLVFNVSVTRIVKDIEGNKYQIVKIGNQWWMAENLKVIHYRNGDAIPNVTGRKEWGELTSGAYCDYDNYPRNAEVYNFGRLYNWYAVNDSRNIAPLGWHVPEDAAWKELEMFLGMSRKDADDWGDKRGTDEGGKLKESGTSHWAEPNTGATNETGFSALPCGLRKGVPNPDFQHMSVLTYFWSASSPGTQDDWYRSLSDGSARIARNTAERLGYQGSDPNIDHSGRGTGMSVRCVKD